MDATMRCPFFCYISVLIVLGGVEENVYCILRKLGSKLFNRLGFAAIFHGQYFMYTIADLCDKLSE